MISFIISLIMMIVLYDQFKNNNKPKRKLAPVRVRSNQ
ncbi:hypothetical protein PEDI_16060 [Persicobacter diffluens]|uniref:Uncharacterized protein n=1 Tax=Persicobacter diffluens TaxID=981 RepID=A0AAN4VXH5_9BACT|nr:hypothetical protein PEDI_16060 [Persicobacter diffluens]